MGRGSRWEARICGERGLWGACGRGERAPGRAQARAVCRFALWYREASTGGTDPLRLAPVLLASLFGVALLFALHAGAPDGALPLDDAYIHLSLARTLAEHGVWGLFPGEAASASSSPLWTLVLAALFWLDRPAVRWALLGNAAALGAVIALADRRLAGCSASVRTGALLALCLLGALPVLGALGMEHLLHAALVLALVAAALGGEERPGGASPGVLAGLAAAATAARFESLAPALALALLAGRRRAWREAAALAAGALGVVALHAALSSSIGGPWLPASILKKAGVVSLGATLGRLAQEPALPALAIAALGTAAAGRGRPRLLLFVACLGAQVLFGNVGWLYRYEAWLVIWGLVELGAAWLGPGRRGGWGAALALAATLLALLPVGARAQAALAGTRQGAAFVAQGNLPVARWLAGLPGEGAHAAWDIGAVAWLAHRPLVDLGGIATEALARPLRERRLDAETLAAVLAARDVRVAVIGDRWPVGGPPAGAEVVARFFTPFPAPPGSFETVIWSLDPTATAGLRARIRADRGDWPATLRWIVPGDPEVALDEAAIDGAAVEHREGRVFLYTNGGLRFDAPASGRLWLAVEASPAEGRLPRFAVQTAAGETSLEAPAAGELAVGEVRQGEPVVIRYDDDLVDAQGFDRNLTLVRAWVATPEAPPGALDSGPSPD